MFRFVGRTVLFATLLVLVSVSALAQDKGRGSLNNYSANLQTGTVNGSISVDFPVTVQGRITKELAVSLGSGGATVRAMTTNGGVRIKRGSLNN